MSAPDEILFLSWGISMHRLELTGMVYETCVGPHESGIVNLNSTKFLDFVRSHGLAMAIECSLWLLVASLVGTRLLPLTQCPLTSTLVLISPTSEG